MKVKELVKKAGIYKGQSILVIDHSNNTVEGITYKMPLSEKLTNATVNSFNVSEQGIRIHITLKESSK